MISLPVVEFYITNVCNLTCRGCNRFNNYSFKGHQYWDDFSAEYKNWSQRVDIKNITIIGGEPTLNPDLESWAQNLRSLWPNSNIMVQSNGTYIQNNFFDFWKKYQVGFAISLHDLTTAEDIITTWKDSIGDYYDIFLKGFVFHQAAVTKKGKVYTVHNSDAQHAFNCCDMKYDHTMFKGKLYKCPTTAILPEFDRQYKLTMTEEQQEIFQSYTPLESSCSEQQLQDFILQKDNAIDYCRFCPSSLKWHPALGENKEMEPGKFDHISLTEIKLLKQRIQ
jgi:organic radical activating enzyme